MAQIAFTLSFDGGQEVPPRASSATGTGLVVFDTTTNIATYTWKISGLDFGSISGQGPATATTADDVTGFHFHNNVRGQNGPIVFDIPSQDTDDLAIFNTGGNTWTISGAWEPTDPANTSINSFAAVLAGATIGSDVPLYGNVHTNTFTGGEIRGQWVASADDNANTIIGSNSVLGNILNGLGGNDILVTGAGNDVLFGGAGNDILHAGAGNDTIIDDNGASSEMNGEDGDDSMTGGTGNDYMVGGAGNDTIVGGGDGQDSMYGGDGNDYIVAADGNSDGIGSVLDGGTGSNQLYALVGLGNDYAVGGDLGDIIATGAGSDFIFGNGGADTIVAGTGTDFIYSGAGNDFIYTDDLITPTQDFVYVSGQPGFGTGVDTVADFTPGTGGDVAVVLQTPGITTFADIQSRMSDIGVYTVINLSASDQLFLYNVDPFQLNANNFLFL